MARVPSKEHRGIVQGARSHLKRKVQRGWRAVLDAGIHERSIDVGVGAQSLLALGLHAHREEEGRQLSWFQVRVRGWQVAAGVAVAANGDSALWASTRASNGEHTAARMLSAHHAQEHGMHAQHAQHAQRTCTASKMRIAELREQALE